MEFIDFKKTPGEKHLGIATIKYNGIILRYKIIPTKDGKNCFAAPSAYKVTENYEDRYIPAFVIDSQTDDQRVKDFMLGKVREVLYGAPNTVSLASAPVAQSLFTPPAPEQEELPF